MLRANPRVLSTALFSALGLLPLSCGGASSGDEGKAGGSGGSSTGNTSSGGASSTAGKPTSGGSKSSAGSSSGGGSCVEPEIIGNGYERCGDGPIHRPSIQECESSLPRAGTQKIAPPADGQCATDADCADMPHGYCAPGVQLPGNVCHHGCVKDSECGAGNICVCGDPVGHCAGSTCASDAECGRGLRCQSYDSSHGCGIERFACQTPDDTCSSDADCNGGYCDAASGSFACVMGGCAIGRPFLVEGSERLAPLAERADWCDELALTLGEMSAAARERVAAGWLGIAAMEHASVAAFARFALQLLQLGAPPELVEGATRAMADETRHARVAFGIASCYSGRKLGPGALDVERSLEHTSLLEIVRLVVREGCIGETAAALEAREAAEHAADPALARLLHGVADDETRHAELAWRFVSWALERSPRPVAELLRLELRQVEPQVSAQRDPSAEELALMAHGLIPEPLRGSLRNSAFRQVVAPCAAALLERAAGNQELSASALS